MARSFAITGPDFLENGSAAVTGVPLTLAARINIASIPPTTTIPYIALSICDANANSRFWIDVHRSPTNYYAEANSSSNGTDSGVAAYQNASAFLFTNEWHNLVGVFSTTSAREVYYDNTVGNNHPAATVTPAGLDTTRIGAFLYSGGTYGAFDGRIADAAVWNAALTAAEVAQYNLGVSPLLIRPGALVSYWPLHGRATNEEDWVGGRLMTATNTAAYAHPRTIPLRSRGAVYFGPISTATTSNLDATESGSDTFAGAGTAAGRAAQTFYIDNAGSDGNSGLSGSPWQTAAAVNAFTFIPGDKLVFTAGQTFAGPFTFTASGTAGSYIVITTTGRSTTVPTLPGGGVAQSSPATIAIADGAGNGINVEDAEYVWLDNLAVQGSGVNTTTGATTATAVGVNLHSTQATNKLRGVKLTALSVTGCRDGFLAWCVGGKVGWDGLQLWGCVSHANQGWAFMTPCVYNFATRTGSGPEGQGYTQNNDLYIGYCQAYDHPGNTAGVIQAGGIYPYNCDGGVVEYCVVHDIGLAGTSTAAGSPGFHLAACNELTIQYCEAYKIYANAAGYDGEGFDIEGGCVNCVIQYCYAHDCDSAGFLACKHTIRYNVAYNNNVVADTWTANTSTHIYSSICHSVASGSNSGDMYVYGNTVYAPNGDAFGITHIGANSNYSRLYNNVLVSKAGSRSAHIYNAQLLGNVYSAIGGGTTTVLKYSGSVSYTSIAALRAAGYETHSAVDYGAFADPLLNDPTGAPSAGTLPSAPVATLRYWDVAANSPAINAGIDYSLVSVAPGSTDFHGAAIPIGAYDAGAVETNLCSLDATESGGDTFAGTATDGSSAATLTADLAANESESDTFDGAGTHSSAPAAESFADLAVTEAGNDAFAGRGINYGPPGVWGDAPTASAVWKPILPRLG